MPVAGLYTVRNSRSTVNYQAIQLLKPDPSRVAILINISGGASQFLAPYPFTATADAWSLANARLPIEFSYYQHGDLVLGEWWGYVTLGNNFFITEILELPGARALRQQGDS